MGSRTGVPASKWLITRAIGLEHWKHLSRPIRVVPFQTYGTKTLSILVVILSYESCFAYYWGKFGCFSLRLLNFRSVISCWRKGAMRMLLKMWKKSEGKQWWFDLRYTREEQQFIFANLSKVKRGENKFCERISLDGGMKAFFSLMVFLGNLFFEALSIFHRVLKY